MGFLSMIFVMPQADNINVTPHHLTVLYSPIYMRLYVIIGPEFNSNLLLRPTISQDPSKSSPAISLWDLLTLQQEHVASASGL
jgi:hypothetical protein